MNDAATLAKLEGFLTARCHKGLKPKHVRDCLAMIQRSRTQLSPWSIVNSPAIASWKHKRGNVNGLYRS